MLESIRDELVFAYVRTNDDRYHGKMTVVKGGETLELSLEAGTRSEWVRFVVETIRAHDVPSVLFRFGNAAGEMRSYRLDDSTVDRIRDASVLIDDFVI